MTSTSSIFEVMRPTRFSEFVGNARAKRLVKGLLSSSIRPGLVITGPYGCGKTSLARLVARAIVCERPEAGEPCGLCASCYYTPRGTTSWGRGISVRNCADYSDAQLKTDLMDSHYASAVPHVLILDEFHRAKTKLSDQLLTWVEDDSANLVVLLLTPFANLVDPPLVQRLTSIQLSCPTMEEAVNFLLRARDRMGYSVSDSDVVEICEANAAQLRACLNLLHAHAAETRVGAASGM